ncbi:hypothetical protein [Propionibacterium sp. oral taxon 192]|uniref:hypothetical protein n=1 Tax=Propionibacterium sp. oral taxon 192 TaxID=671222 RepID=UPI001E5FE953|nr:hypothetical protein [Propionibacterium sp. oral taxon 192]
MSTRDDLTLTFQTSKVGDDAVIDEPFVEIILGLIDHERSVRRCAEQEKEQGGRALPLQQISHLRELTRACSCPHIQLHLHSLPNRLLLELAKRGSPASSRARTCAPVIENCALSSDFPYRAACTKARVEKFSWSIAAMM